jgi:NADPH-dependent dioxygenase
MQKADVLIAGAGPVGLFVAHSLTRAGIPVHIVDAGMWPCAHSYALALHPRAVELLSSAGIDGGLLESGRQIRSFALYDERGRRAEIDLTRGTTHPMIVLPQSALEAHLESAINQAGVHVQWRHKVMNVDSNHAAVQVALNRYEKESCGYAIAHTEWAVAKSWTESIPFVVGADGYNSSVRRSIGLKFPEVAPCAWYAVFEFHSEVSVQNEVRVVLGDDTTDVVWPLGEGLFRWSFEMPGYVDAEVDRLAKYREHFGMPSNRTKDRVHFTTGDVDELSDGQLTEFVAQRAPWFEGRINGVQWRTIVRFERRLSTAFGKDRCWLAGDAAHLGGPVGVQSLNVGLAEANDLSSALVGALQNGHGEDLLAAYNDRYLAEWKRLSGAAGDIEAIGQVDPWIWKNRNRLLSCLPAHGADLTALAAQLGLQV